MIQHKTLRHINNTNEYYLEEDIEQKFEKCLKHVLYEKQNKIYKYIK